MRMQLTFDEVYALNLAANLILVIPDGEQKLKELLKGE